jgi:serine/arginine repetitive matrix protein 2
MPVNPHHHPHCQNVSGTNNFAYARNDDARVIGHTLREWILWFSWHHIQQPWKLLLSSQVFQVANSNTMKDCFLFLFNDILIITKPVTHEYDALLDMNKPSPLDWKFIMKSIVQLCDVQFTANRDDLLLSPLASISWNPPIRTFVVQFAKDADSAISHFFEKSGTCDDLTVLSQLLFRMLDETG